MGEDHSLYPPDFLFKLFDPAEIDILDPAAGETDEVVMVILVRTEKVAELTVGKDHL